MQEVVSGAKVYSHPQQTHKHQGTSQYSDNIDCRITFRAEDKKNGRLMLRIIDLDIPDKSLSELCNDALYVFDANNIFGKSVVSGDFNALQS